MDAHVGAHRLRVKQSTGMSTATAGWVGRSIERVEDAALLTGAGRFIDDLGVRPGTLHAAVLRSPHAHAVIRSIKTDAARRAAGVYAIVTGAEVMALSAPLLAGVKSPVNSWPIAVDRVRYAGEPVAVAVATDRYVAEDALDLIEVEYQPLPVVMTPLEAADASSTPLHDGLGGNVASDRTFSYGNPSEVFEQA